MMDALIFDLDGVIADTVTLHNHTWLQVLDEANITPEPELLERTRGLSRRGIFDLLFGDVVRDEAQIEAILARKNALYGALMAAMTPADVLPGVRDWIQEARALGMRVGVGSASRNARTVLTQVGLADAFDVVGDGGSVVNAKPAPDIFVWVCGALGVNPSRALIVEDGAAGITAAHRAGCAAVGVGAGDTSAADIVVASLAELSLKNALERLSKRTPVHKTHELR